MKSDLLVYADLYEMMDDMISSFTTAIVIRENPDVEKQSENKKADYSLSELVHE
jgi:hypothetical protein